MQLFLLPLCPYVSFDTVPIEVIIEDLNGELLCIVAFLIGLIENKIQVRICIWTIWSSANIKKRQIIEISVAIWIWIAILQKIGSGL